MRRLKVVSNEISRKLRGVQKRIREIKNEDSYCRPKYRNFYIEVIFGRKVEVTRSDSLRIHKKEWIGSCQQSIDQKNEGRTISNIENRRILDKEEVYRSQ